MLPTAVVLDARTRHVFVANFGSNTVSVLDADSGAILTTVGVVPHPSTLAEEAGSPSGRAGAAKAVRSGVVNPRASASSPMVSLRGRRRTPRSSGAAAGGAFARGRPGRARGGR
jgi:YVTN family beta-propeller protein